ncbi:MAG: ATP-binding protein [Gaiellaceae bacterium]
MTRRPLEWWISVVRLLALPLAFLQVVLTTSYPDGYEAIAWALLAAFAVGAVVLFATVRESRAYSLVAMAFDFVVISGFVVLYAFDTGTPVRQLLFLAIVVGAARFGMRGGIAVALAAIPVSALFEQQRSHWSHVGYRTEFVVFQVTAGMLIALVVGWVVARLNEERVRAEERAGEAEALRDELGRRADLLDAANRCARALGSSLDLDDAFGAFIRELRGLVEFDRLAIVLAEDGGARIIATAGDRAEGDLAPGAEFSAERSLISDVVAQGQTIYRRDMTEPRYVEEPALLELGLRSRVAAPLLLGARAIGLLSLGRREPDSFSEHEIELASLLGRLAGSAVQNIRAYDSERRTVEELRNLSKLRADFVSLVSHELRAPMATVIGAARTLQVRWRELEPGQRESFLALIGDETTRLAALIGDVLDTSRIDAGTFTYRFGDVDVGSLVRATVAAAALGQDEVPVRADIAGGLPTIRGDAERLRQVFGNLIENAVKYSPVGEPVEVRVSQSDGTVLVVVRDHGPGIRTNDQRLIFEKFGRVAGAVSKPGTGLGLYIARSIAETHGGTIAVTSTPGHGATFTVRLPLAA